MSFSFDSKGRSAADLDAAIASPDTNCLRIPVLNTASVRKVKGKVAFLSQCCMRNTILICTFRVSVFSQQNITS